jgi:hypothetical protein
MLIASRAHATMTNHPTSTTGTQASDADKVVQLHATTEVAEERARRLGVEVERLARLPTVEWILYLEDTAKKYGVTSAQLKQMVEKTIKAAEKKRLEDKAENRQREQRVDRQRTAAQREQRRAQKEANKKAEKRQRERDKALAEITKLPSTVREQQLAVLAKRLDEDLDFLREEFSAFVAVEEASSDIDYIEPWPEPVELHALLMETMAQVRRYVVLHDDAAAAAVTLWIAFAWVHEIAVHSPILEFTGAEPDTGKTTACGVVKFLTPRAHAAAELTGPNLYRFVDHLHPTLIIDDADLLFARKPDLVHIVNVGWTRGTKIPRQVHGVTRWFDPFCAKVIAGVSTLLPKTTKTRVITVKLLPKLSSEKIEVFNHIDDDTFLTLRRKLARFATDYAVVLKDADPAMSGFNNRTAMNWRLLVAIADLAGGEWSKVARTAASKLVRERREPSEGKRLLAAIRDLFAAHGVMLTSDKVQSSLTADSNSEWAEFRGRGPISKRQIAVLLAPYGIHPDVIHPRGHLADRVYRAEWFAQAFRHYLPELPQRKRTSLRKPADKP